VEEAFATLPVYWLKVCKRVSTDRSRCLGRTLLTWVEVIWADSISVTTRYVSEYPFKLSLPEQVRTNVTTPLSKAAVPLATWTFTTVLVRIAMAAVAE